MPGYGALFLLLTWFSCFSVARASVFYISPSGQDTNAGTTIKTAWKTIDRVNAAHFRPGDQILFEGGRVFKGAVWLRRPSYGTAARPLLISSYGAGRATISSGASYGLYVQNLAGVEVRRLAFAGLGRLHNQSSGIVFFLDLAATHLPHVVLDDLTVTGYQKSGISIGSWKGTSGYDQVRITNCELYANGEAGLSSYAQGLRAHHNWYVAHCKAYNNTGRPEITTTHTGNGIVLSGIDGAVVEHCEAYNNGELSANPNGGPVGIWGWCCHRLVIQHCESHHNRSGTRHDGGGFDLDGGCTNSVLQYNYSHDNEGPGYMLVQYAGAPPMHDVVIRHNVSENDDRRYGQGAILLWAAEGGKIQRASIHHNKICLTPPRNGSATKGVHIGLGMEQVSLRHNQFHLAPALPVFVFEPSASQGVDLQDNVDAHGQAVQFYYEGIQAGARRRITGWKQVRCQKPGKS